MRYVIRDTRIDGACDIRLQCTGRGLAGNQTMVIYSSSMNSFELSDGTWDDTTTAQRREPILEVLRDSGEDGMTSEEIAALLGQPLKTVENRLTEMFKADLIIKLPKRGNTQVYRAADPFAD